MQSIYLGLLQSSCMLQINHSTTIQNHIIMDYILLQIFSLACLSFAGLSFPIPPTDDINGRFQPLAFENNYATLWGEPKVLEDGGTVQLRLDRHSGGGGFASSGSYYHAFYSASIKLPSNYTAGVVLAFYTSNANNFPNTHDELDFELLGNLPGQRWKIQTNIYGNGSVSRGREERFDFWFDPTTDFHDYSILWNHKHIVFMVDNIPIREMKRSDELKGDYPSKPMGLYATIWDGSQWATEGGKYPVNYEYEPFVATFGNLKLEGCSTNPIQEKILNKCGEGNYNIINPARENGLDLLTHGQRVALEWVRRNQMYYSYCNDKRRYPTPLPECNDESPIKSNDNGYMKVKRHSRRHHIRAKARTLTEEANDNLDIKFSTSPPSFQLMPSLA